MYVESSAVLVSIDTMWYLQIPAWRSKMCMRHKEFWEFWEFCELLWFGLNKSKGLQSWKAMTLWHLWHLWHLLQDLIKRWRRVSHPKGKTGFRLFTCDVMCNTHFSHFLTSSKCWCLVARICSCVFVFRSTPANLEPKLPWNFMNSKTSNPVEYGLIHFDDVWCT